MIITPQKTTKFTLRYKDIEDNEHYIVWTGMSLWDDPDSHPFKTQGLQFTGMGERDFAFVPWHQVKLARLTVEKVDKKNDTPTRS